MKKGLALLVLLSCGISVFSDQGNSASSRKIPFNGLTGTICDLLKTKPKARILLGSCRMDPGDIVEKSIDKIFDCDEVSNKYLTENDECYYERLAEIIKEKIGDNIMDKTACVYVMVDASEDGSIATISIAVNYSKNAILPVYIDTANSELKVSFAMPCVIEYDISFSVEVDSEKVNADDKLNGTSIKIDNYTVNIKPYEDEWNYTATLAYNNALYEVKLEEHSIQAYANWTLVDDHGNDEEAPKITYEQLSTGDYRWDIGSMSYLSFSGKVNSPPGQDEMLELSAAIDDSMNIEDQGIEVTDEEGTRELGIKVVEFQAVNFSSN